MVEHALQVVVQFVMRTGSFANLELILLSLDGDELVGLLEHVLHEVVRVHLQI